MVCALVPALGDKDKWISEASLVSIANSRPVEVKTLACLPACVCMHMMCVYVYICVISALSLLFPTSPSLEYLTMLTDLYRQHTTLASCLLTQPWCYPPLQQTEAGKS